jgi:hypothetical protein
MSIKDLFGKSYKNYQSASAAVESSAYIDSEVNQRETFLPPIDFSTASNFVKYGSAELYYSKAISNVYGDYPYDGSDKEKNNFHLSSSYLDRWIFDNKYPKSTGYVNLGTTGYNGSLTEGYGGTSTDEYIRVWGGLHTASSGMTTIRDTFGNSIKYDLALNRTQNWRVNPSDGATVEFWLKKDSFNLSDSEREVILDLWNGEASSSTAYGRLTLEITGGTGGCFVATFQSGTAGFYRQTVCSALIDTGSLANWHHYAISFISASSATTTRFYVDGRENRTQNLGTATNEFDGLITGYLGALQSSPSGNVFHGTTLEGYGKLSASVDEFRFWKVRRTSDEINLNWFTNVGGGANSDDETSNNNLGVYFKFNEGITTKNSTDQTVLDYSGRLANGYWEGYSSVSQRNTGSAFVSSSHNLVESGDPIIYSTHPSVVALQSEMATSGSDHDNAQGNSLFKTLPQWMQDEDLENDSNLKYLTQILSSYFDTLYSQISALPDLKKKKFVESNEKALPFANALLSEKGFVTRDIFANSEIIEIFGNKDREGVYYSENIQEIKNLIYTNIYNNLETIYKSKGTEKSIRNLIRCFGVDDEIIKLNVYTDGGTHYFTDKAKATSVRKKYINFDDPNYFSSTIYQTSSATNSLTFISGSTGSSNGSNNAFTLEADIVVPHKKESSETGFYNTAFLSSSIFGFHEAIESDSSDYTWATSETASLSVYLVRDELESKRAKFVVESQDGTLSLTSSYIENIYDNNHWNIALRIKPDTYPYAGNVTDTSPSYTVEFYGIDYNFDEIEHEIILTASISNASGSAFLSNPKRVYAGAHLTNFTGSVLERSDIQLGSVRAWLDYISNDAIKQHNLDPLNFGGKESFRGSNIFAFDNKHIPSQELTILNWDFDTVTSSDSSGDFVVDDITSGSSDTIYGWIDEVIRREYRGKGDGFGTSTSTFIENEFLYSQRKELPEISFTNDNIFIKGDREKFFIKDDDVSDNFYMAEKSLNQVVSEEMLKLFSTIQEFANLIARPVDRYRINYKRLDKVRQHFFDRVEEDIDQESFIKYYRWIDASISEMIMQLVPASVNFGDGVTDVVESHILERNKYQRRPGLLDTIESTEGSVRGVEELTYNWKTGHATTDENTNCLWQKQRKERTDINDRDRIRKVLENENGLAPPNLAEVDNTIYQGSTYAIRKLSKPYKLSVSMNNSVHGGVNYNQQKNRDFYRTTIAVHGPISEAGAPRNIIGIGIGRTDGIDERQKCDDVLDPNEKYFYNAIVQVGSYTADSAGVVPHDDSASYSYRVKASNWWPFNLKSGSIATGYNSLISSSYVNNPLVVVNLHSDTIDITNEIPMQGPFAQAHVGGHQGRHVNLNKYDTSLVTEGGGAPTNNIDDQYTRPEAYRLLVGDNPYNVFTPDGALGITGPDYGLPYPNTTREWAIYYREERAKRPVNVRNIQTTTGSSTHGNYQHKYEVLSTFGNQRYLFRRETGSLLPAGIASELPQTTNYMTLLGQAAWLSGNIFGGGQYSNRQPDANALITTPGVSPAAASGSFSVLGKDYITTSDSIEFDNLGGETWGITGASVDYQVATGSSDLEFWQNLTASIRSNSPYLPTLVTSSTTYSEGVQVTRRNGSFLSASIGSSEIATGAFTFACWMKLDGGSGALRYLYREMTSAGLDRDENDATNNGRFIRLDNDVGGRLRMNVAYYAADTADFRNDQYYFENFNSNFAEERVHIVWTHSGSVDSTTAGHLYINGVERTLVTSAGGGTGTKTQNTPAHISILNSRTDGSATNTITQSGSAGDSSIDEIVILNTTASQTAVDALYNCGERVILSNIYSTIPSASIRQYWSFEGASVADEATITGEGAAALDLDVNNVSSCFAMVSGTNGASPSSLARGTIQLTASSFGPDFNTTFTIASTPCPAFRVVQAVTGGVDEVVEVSTAANDIVIEIPRADLTSSQHIIQNRFSAPGGPEVNSRGYLDIATGEYSVYNAINYRNLSVRSSGSGESGTIRANSHNNRREGLRTLLSRHQGQFGIDSQYGSVSETTYEVDASFQKQHRNTLVTPRSSSATVIDAEVFDNAYVSSLLPRSDYQYSWINNAISGSDWRAGQKVYGFAPKNGMLSSSSGFDAAITFPTASQLYGE